MKIKKLNYIFSLAFIIILLVQNSIYSADIGLVIEDETPIDKYIGTEKKINAKNVELTQADGITIVEVKKGGFVSIFTSEEGKNRLDVFDNIKEGGKLAIDKNGDIVKAEFTTNERGGEYVFGNDQINAPPNSKVKYDKKEIFIEPPKGSRLTSLPELVDKTIPGNTVIIDSGKNEIELPLGNKFAGSLISRDEILSIDSTKAAIDGIKIDGDGKRVTEIYLDGKRHTETMNQYISINKEKKEVIIENPINSPFPGSSFKFEKENNMVRIEDEDYFSVEPNKGGGVYIRNRGDLVEEKISVTDDFKISKLKIPEDALIPEVKLLGEVIIDDGDRSLFFKDGKMLGGIGIKGKTSTPIAITSIRDSEGAETLKGQWVISNFEELAYLEPGEEFGSIEKTKGRKDLQIKVSPTLRENYMYSNEDFEKETGIKLDGFNDERVIDTLKGYIRSSPMQSVKIIKVRPTSDVITSSGSAGAFYGPDEQSITFGLNSLARYEHFRHELAHAKHYNMPDVEKYKFEKKWQNMMNSKYGQFSTSIEGNEVWKEFENVRYHAQSSGLDLDGPREGFIRPYGSKDINEHISTYVEEAISGSRTKEILRFTDPKSNDYDPRYAFGFYMVYEAGLITPEEYRKVSRDLKLGETVRYYKKMKRL